MGNPKKRDHQKAVRTTVTIPPILLEHCPAIFHRMGYTGLSDYIQSKLRADAGLDRGAISLSPAK
jgi:hypothetical protein